MIPRIMHQAYIGGALPDDLRANVEAHRARNPGWHHILWDDARSNQFIPSIYGAEMMRTYERIDSRYPAARVDLLCNLIIQHHGGVYFDIKSVFERPLDDVLRPTDRYLLAQWRNRPGEANAGWGLHHDLDSVPGGEYIKYFIIAEPVHPYSKAIIDKICSNVHSYKPWAAVGRTGTLRTTGPIAYTLGIRSVIDPALHRVVTEAEIGASPSLAGAYDHAAALPTTHYSKLKLPIVKQGIAGSLISRAATALREIKAAARAAGNRTAA